VSEYTQTYSAKIAASPEECFRVVTDFPAYPRWSSPIKECRVVEAYPDGLPKHVAFTLEMPLKTIRYTLEYAYQAPHSVRWHLVEGDVKDVQGSYDFSVAGSGTSATCTQEIDLGFWVPGPIRRMFEQKALRDSVEEFRAAVESRTGA